MARTSRARSTSAASRSSRRRTSMPPSDGPAAFRKRSSSTGRPRDSPLKSDHSPADDAPLVSPADIDSVFRREYGRAVRVRVRRCGSIEMAEEVVQDAFAAALEHWPSAGLPPSPAGWIITTARRRAIDRFRRERTRDGRHEAAGWTRPDPVAPDASVEEIAVEDERLRLIFTCCHPALASTAQVALTLRLLGGLGT